MNLKEHVILFLLLFLKSMTQNECKLNENSMNFTGFTYVTDSILHNFDSFLQLKYICRIIRKYGKTI